MTLTVWVPPTARPARAFAEIVATLSAPPLRVTAATRPAGTFAEFVAALSAQPLRVTAATRPTVNHLRTPMVLLLGGDGFLVVTGFRGQVRTAAAGASAAGAVRAG